MPKTLYHISLKGYVGGWDFDRSDVDAVLAENDGKRVNVLIDSLGGSLATGLSISAAFRNHGDVAVHFVGLNASAATIASLGAAHISIDTGGMYLVHKCSTAFFEWGSLNSDQFATLIADCEKIKADLDKLDLNVAQLYARKCRKPVADLLALMKVGGWLTAQEALDWGFVDEITDLADEDAPKLTDAIASAMANVGMPIPNIPISDSEKESAFGKFLAALTSFFRPSTTVPNSIHSTMHKTYKFLSAILADKPLTVTDGKTSLTETQLDSIETALAEKDKLAGDRQAQIEVHEATIRDKDATIADLHAKLAKKPADESKQIVDNGSKGEPSDKSEAEIYCETVNSARALYNEV